MESDDKEGDNNTRLETMNLDNKEKSYWFVHYAYSTGGKPNESYNCVVRAKGPFLLVKSLEHEIKENHTKAESEARPCVTNMIEISHAFAQALVDDKITYINMYEEPEKEEKP